MKKLAIIGANEFQCDLIEKAKSMGVETHVFSWGGGEPGELLADYFYEVDIKNRSEILSKCKSIGVDGVCSIASDLANITVHWVANELGFKAHSQYCIEATTNKFKMREALSQQNIPVPDYYLINSLEELDSLKLSFPCIVKPTDRSGSRGVIKVSNYNQLTEAYHESKSHSFSDEVIVEEFVDGSEFSVESFSVSGKHDVLQITEKFTTGSPNYVEVAHLSPARLTTEQVRRIEEVVSQSLNALGVQDGPAHSEIKVCENDRITVIEVGSRMGGDFIGSYIVPTHTGIDYVKLTIASALGEVEKNSVISSLPVQSEAHYVAVYYQIEKDSPSIDTLSDANIKELLLNANYSPGATSSGERYSCSKIVFHQKLITKFVSMVEQSCSQQEELSEVKK